MDSRVIHPEKMNKWLNIFKDPASEDLVSDPADLRRAGLSMERRSQTRLAASLHADAALVQHQSSSNL